MRALLVEKVFPALEELERRGVCDQRLRLGIAAEVDDLTLHPGDADFDVYEWF